MKSRTSFFNKTVLRKDILRYSPVWALYTIFLLLVLFGLADYSRETIASTVADFMKAMVWINLIYGGVCGVFLFMDLFNGRLCNALHAFPIRRENWLATHVLSGMLFSLIPNLLVTGIGAFMLWEYAYLAPIWLAITTLQFVFFFGTAVLAAICAGNLLGTAAVYGIIHFVTIFVYAVVQILYQPLLFGVRLNSNMFYRFFPLDQLDGFDYVKLEYHYEEIDQYVEFVGLQGAAWRYVGICAAVGVLCVFLATMVYRRRNLETAGDFISLRPLAPLFLLVCTVSTGVFLYMFSDLVGNKTYLFLALGMVIGYFAGKMLLERTLKVFGKKSIFALAVVLLVFGSSLGLTWLDPLGITSYVPKTETIKNAKIIGADKSYYWRESSLFDDSSYVDRGYEITDAEELADLQAFHRQLLDYRPSENETLCSVRIIYTLKSGRTVTRYYEVGKNSVHGQQIAKYFSDMRYVFEINDTDALDAAFESVYVDIFDGKQNVDFKLTDPKEITGLLDAIAKDCQAGKMAQNWALHENTDKDVSHYVEFYAKDEFFEQVGWNTSRFYLQIYPDSINTLSYLNKMRDHHYEEESIPQSIPDPIPE